MGKNVFKTCQFAGIGKFYVPEIDRPEPKKPDEPKLSSNASLEEQLAYQKKIVTYQDKMKVWNEAYKDWNLKYNRAISEAEGNINGLYEKFGQAYNVNVTSHLTTFAFFVAAMLALTVAVQKVKDFI